MRDIAEIVLFRGDLSPFLIHLTRNLDGVNAGMRLRQMLNERRLIPGDTRVSDVRFGGYTNQIDAEEQRRLFSAICFTETPLSEIHCLLEIEGRAVNLEPYGLVFLKTRLRAREVSPVIYVNNEGGVGDDAIRALFSLRPHAFAHRVLPLVAVFGLKVWPPGAVTRPPGSVDFLWEREWRRPAALGNLDFAVLDIFCGLCPHDEIEDFEIAYPPLKFIDPTRNMKWYAQSLIVCRQRLDLKHSVV